MSNPFHPLSTKAAQTGRHFPIVLVFLTMNPSVAKAGGVQSQGANGEAVVIYCDPLATQDLGASGFPGRVKNEKIIVAPLDCPFGQIQSFRKKHGF
jgi:hypothetical protein